MPHPSKIEYALHYCVTLAHSKCVSDYNTLDTKRPQPLTIAVFYG